MPLGNDIVQVWFTDLAASRDQVHRLSDLLNEQELQRVQQYRFAESRRRFIGARAFLRQLLANYLQLEAKCVQFRYEIQGKPALAHHTDLEFNLSHSGDVACAAVTRGRRVGIDIEVVHEVADCEDIARRYFRAAEANRIACRSGEQRRRSFFLHWTGKEAYLKAQGDGLFAPLDSFEVIPSDQDGTPQLFIKDLRDRNHWSVRLILPSEDVICAVVAGVVDRHWRSHVWISPSQR